MKRKGLILVTIFLALCLGLCLVGCSSDSGTSNNDKDSNTSTYQVKIHIDFTENLIFSRYDVTFSLDKKDKKLSHGEDADYEFNLPEGEYTLSFKKEGSSIKSEIKLMVDSNLEASYKISCKSDKIKLEEQYVDREITISADDVKMKNGAEDFEGEGYKTVIQELKDLGFTNFTEKPIYDIYFGITPEGSVDKVSINGNSSFKRGDIFPKDANIEISYHMNYKDDPAQQPDKPDSPDSDTPEKPSSVFYSTNDYDTAKKGNTGVFSYRDRAALYDKYWIIDFDEGYVYNFTEGNDDPTCDRIKIVSGTLNDAVTITYHDGDDVWSYKLHFKYVNSPVTLILVDQNGHDWEYSTTDLSKALTLRATKRIKDY